MRHGHNAFQYQSSPNNLHFIKSLCNSSMPRIASSCVNANGGWNVTFQCLLAQNALGNHVGNRTVCICILRPQIIKREKRPLKIAHANLTGTMKAKHSSGFPMPHSAAMTYPVDVASEPRLIVKSFNAPFVCFPFCFVYKTILTSFFTSLCLKTKQNAVCNAVGNLMQVHPLRRRKWLHVSLNRARLN